jgi:CRP-like cAMP-binding protein
LDTRSGDPQQKEVKNFERLS